MIGLMTARGLTQTLAFEWILNVGTTPQLIEMEGKAEGPA